VENLPIVIERALGRILRAKTGKGGGLSLRARAVLAEVVVCGAPKTGAAKEIHVRLDTLGELTGLEPRTVDRAIKDLVEAGLVVRSQRVKASKADGGRPSVATTVLSCECLDWLFVGATKVSSTSPEGTTKVSNINGESLISNVDTKESPACARTHAYMREGGGEHVDQPETKTGIQPPRAEKGVRGDLTFFQTEFGWDKSKIFKMLGLCRSAGIWFQTDVWPLFGESIMKSEDKFGFIHDLVKNPNIKEIIANKKNKIEAAKIEYSKKQVLDINKNRISEFSGRTFDFINLPDLQIQISGPLSIFKVQKSTGKRRPISQSDFFQSLDNNELVEYKSHNQKLKLVG
jgi:hypothetical protein